MTVEEARRIAEEFEQKQVHTEEEEFLFTEAMRFLIGEEKDPGDMMWLGGYYYEQRHFDLALKYYEMARACDYDEAYECLGYIWYYGRTGEKDHILNTIFKKGTKVRFCCGIYWTFRDLQYTHSSRLAGTQISNGGSGYDRCIFHDYRTGSLSRQ